MTYSDQGIEISRNWHTARQEIEDALLSLNKKCVCTGMSTGESPSNYLSVGFGGVAPERCDFLLTVLTDDNIFLSVDDGVTWVNIFDPTEVGAFLATGIVAEYGGDEDNIPTGWLMADGQAVSRTTYADLFAEIGTTFGVGDNSTTFNLPDLRAKTPLGANSASYPNGLNGSLTTRAVASTGGTENHQLTIAELPSHLHGGQNPNLSSSVAGGGGNLHSRRQAGTTNNTGSNTGHNNIQPTRILNYIIKT